MSDRELLKLAAKAAGYQVWIEPRSLGCQFDNQRELYLDMRGSKVWNPLTDDGDAIRLAVSLDIHIEPNFKNGHNYVVAGIDNPEWHPDLNPERSLWLAEEDGEDGDDPAELTRRAIVRAAAEIGRDIP